MYPILKSGTMPDWMTSVMKKRHGEEAVEKSEKMISGNYSVTQEFHNVESKKRREKEIVKLPIDKKERMC